MFTQHANAVRIIDHEPRLALGGGPRKLLERSDVTVHAEYTVCGHYRRLLGGFVEHSLCGCGVTMRVALEACSGEQRTVNDRRVAEAIEKNQLATAGERGHHAEVGHVTRRKQQCALAAHKGSKLLFQPRVLDTVAGDEMRRPTTRAGSLCACAHRRRDCRMVCEPEIVIAAEIDERSPVHRREDAIARLDEPVNRGASAC